MRLLPCDTGMQAMCSDESVEGWADFLEAASARTTGSDQERPVRSHDDGRLGSVWSNLPVCRNVSVWAIASRLFMMKVWVRGTTRKSLIPGALARSTETIPSSGPGMSQENSGLRLRF